MHSTLNSSLGVILCRDIAGIVDIDIDIRDEPTDQGVMAVKRIRIWNNDEEKDENNFLLTLCNTDLPKDIRTKYFRVMVDPFVPSQYHCFKCQKYVHEASKCSLPAVFRKCDLEHEGAKIHKGGQVLVDGWRKTSFWVSCGQEDGLPCCPD